MAVSPNQLTQVREKDKPILQKLEALVDEYLLNNADLKGNTIQGQVACQPPASRSRIILTALAKRYTEVGWYNATFRIVETSSKEHLLDIHLTHEKPRMYYEDR